ncbi:ATP-binding protein [Hugonella massiliensis]|uniref:ATP-binding protein n=1 Tax=Hugonella massiliensis TaxID=1720315 RepID=UPI00073EC08C|nr:ATP-binding protein [Hugonella massiliensis]
MIIERPKYLQALIAAMGSDQVKVITGIRRCGKSYLVFTLFKNYLLEQGVPEGNIVEMAFDAFRNKKYRDPDVFYPYAIDRLEQAHGKRYVLLDEVQLLGDFSDVLIDLNSIEDVDVYVTGSNAKLLSRDIATEFRGRGQEIRMAPLSFSEFMSAYDGDKRDGYEEYATYGGLPAILARETPEEKVAYLKSLYDELYIRDIVDRNRVRDEGNFEMLIDILSSAIGSLTNSSRLSATFKSEKHVTIAPETVDRYLSYLTDAFLVSKAKRYDIKGKKYIGSPCKFYFSDLGLRNARMNFRQMEPTHIMENVIYNELVGRGFGVDVGVVNTAVKDARGTYRRTQLEIDFICNKGSQRLYIQSAFALENEAKAQQEERSLKKVDDSFKKVIITKEGFAPHYNEDGILMMNVYDFLLDPNSLSAL